MQGRPDLTLVNLCPPRLRSQTRVPSGASLAAYLPPKESRHLESFSPYFRIRGPPGLCPKPVVNCEEFWSTPDTMVSVPLAYAKLSLLSTPMSSSSAKLWKCTGRCASL